ncbi:hypothetical protein BGX34_000090 [Mortierella sp. NVP85]|nr:hypothetical protein BGX34_000090 [Mortierella sp. NVP85]
MASVLPSATMVSLSARSLTASNMNNSDSTTPIQAPTSSATFPTSRIKVSTGATTTTTTTSATTTIMDDKSNTLLVGPRNFLFKSYLNSKFQCHYAFRVRGDSIEYAKLPIALE